MKSIRIISSVCVLLILSSCVVDYKKLKESEVDDYKIQIARNFAHDFLTKQKNGEVYEIHGGINQSLKEMLSPENQKAGYEELKKMVGDYHSLNYVETYVHVTDRSTHIIRLKGYFERNTDDVEIQVVVDGSNMISGFKISPWNDVLTNH